MIWMSEMSVLWGKNSNSSLTGGCHTPLTHAAIDRTLTTILFSFPDETSSVLRWSYWKKLPALGGWLVTCHISIQGIKFELHAGALPFCYPRPHNYVLFYCNSKKSHSGQCMFWHFIRPFDWRTHVLVQIVSETESDKAVLLHVTPAMPHKFRGDWSWSYFSRHSLFATHLCREVVIYRQNYVHSLRRAKHVQEQCG